MVGNTIANHNAKFRFNIYRELLKHDTGEETRPNRC